VDLQRSRPFSAVSAHLDRPLNFLVQTQVLYRADRHGQVFQIGEVTELRCVRQRALGDFGMVVHTCDKHEAQHS